MEDIFEKESKVIATAEEMIESKNFDSIADEKKYEDLLNEYRKMLKQIKRMVKMSDMMQGKMNQLSVKLEKLSQIDELTGLYNRRFFNEIYQKEWCEAAISKSYLGILMIDVDFFKKYNDTFGHLEGDNCLQRIASSIEETVQGSFDFTARYGGEEFVALLRDASREECIEISEKIIKNIEMLNIPNILVSSDTKVTVSIGIGYMIPDMNLRCETLINVADNALYRAKSDGRNCCRI